MDLDIVWIWLDRAHFCTLTILWMYSYLGFILSWHSDNPDGHGKKLLLWTIGTSFVYLIAFGFVFGDFRLVLSKMLLSFGSAVFAVSMLALFYGLILLVRDLVKREFGKNSFREFLPIFLFCIPFGLWLGVYEGLRLIGWTVAWAEIL